MQPNHHKGHQPLLKRIILGVLFVLTGCTSSLPVNTSEQTYATPPAEHGEMAKYITNLTKNKPSQTGAYALGFGTDAFVSRLSLINAAASSIDLQYYIYNKDTTGNQINYALYRAAERGVQIRLLLDDLKATDNNPKLHILNQHKNVEIRLFNPSPNRNNKLLGFVGDFKKLNGRMHNKSLTVDSLSSIIGGRNIGDEYFGASGRVDFGDFDLLLIGDAISGINKQFDLYWNNALSYPLSTFQKKTYSDEEIIIILTDWDGEISYAKKTKKAYLNALLNTQFIDYLEQGDIPWFWGDAEVVFDLPTKVSDKDNQRPLINSLKTTFDTTQEQLFIISPYFVPGEAGTQYLIDMVNRGVNVSVLTNSLAATDVVAVHSGYATYRKKLLRAGVKVYETKVNPKSKPNAWQGSTQASLHAKSMIFDNKITFVGSLNLDPRSVYLNTEIGVLFSNTELSEKINLTLKQNLNDGAYQVLLKDGELQWYDSSNNTYLDSEPDASIWRRFGAWLTGLLPIEDQI